MSSRPDTFAIVIPTGDNRLQLLNTLAAHAEGLRRSGMEDAEIVVSDNLSADGTAEVVARFAAERPGIRRVAPERRLDMRGDTLAFALAAIDHQHVWPVGDEDLPRPGAAARMRTALRDGRDLVLANARAVDPEGGPARGRGTVLDLDGDADGPVEDLLRRVGFLTTLAASSAVAFRRGGFSGEAFARHRATSPAHALAGAYLDGFHAAAGRIIAEPAFDRRQAPARAPGALSGPLIRSGVLDSLGLVRLFRDLRRRARISRSLLFEIAEPGGELGAATWSHIVESLLDRVEAAMRARDPQTLPSASELDEVLEEFAEAAPELRHLEGARRVAALSEVARGAVTRFSAAAPGSERLARDGPATLPAILPLLDAEARRDISRHVADWASSEIRAVRQLTSRA